MQYYRKAMGLGGSMRFSSPISISCANLATLNLFSYLQDKKVPSRLKIYGFDGNNITCSAYPTGLLWELKEIVFMKLLCKSSTKD